MANNVEPGLRQVGTPETPSQPVSTSPNSAASAIDVDALWSALEPKLTEAIERKTQGVKDKRIAKLQGQVDDFESRLARLQQWEATGKTRAEALLLMKMEDKLGETSEPAQAATPSPQAGNQGQVSAFYVPVLQSMGLDPNSAEVSDILRSSPDVTDQMAKFAALSKSKAGVQQQPPNPATIMPTGGGIGFTPDDTLEAVEAELDRMRSVPMAKRDQKRFRELVDKHAELLKPKRR